MPAKTDANQKIKYIKYKHIFAKQSSTIKTSKHSKIMFDFCLYVRYDFD